MGPIIAIHRDAWQAQKSMCSELHASGRMTGVGPTAANQYDATAQNSMCSKRHASGSSERGQPLPIAMTRRLRTRFAASGTRAAWCAAVPIVEVPAGSCVRRDLPGGAPASARQRRARKREAAVPIVEVPTSARQRCPHKRKGSGRTIKGRQGRAECWGWAPESLQRWCGGRWAPGTGCLSTFFALFQLGLKR